MDIPITNPFITTKKDGFCNSEGIVYNFIVDLRGDNRDCHKEFILDDEYAKYAQWLELNIDSDEDGFSILDNDCNDNDDNIFPNAVDICGDGIDQNCDGIDNVCEKITENSQSDLETNIYPPRLPRVEIEIEPEAQSATNKNNLEEDQINKQIIEEKNNSQINSNLQENIEIQSVDSKSENKTNTFSNSILFISLLIVLALIITSILFFRKDKKKVTKGKKKSKK